MRYLLFSLSLSLFLACNKAAETETEDECPCVRKIFDRTTFPCDNTQADLCYTDTFRTQESSCEAAGTTTYPNDQAVVTTWYRVECP